MLVLVLGPVFMVVEPDGSRPSSRGRISRWSAVQFRSEPERVVWREAMKRNAPKAASSASNSSYSVTDRDGYITIKALIYAIETIHRLPTDRQEPGVAEDMQRLLDYYLPQASMQPPWIDEVRANMNTLRVVSRADVTPLRVVL